MIYLTSYNTNLFWVQEEAQKCELVCSSYEDNNVLYLDDSKPPMKKKAKITLLEPIVTVGVPNHDTASTHTPFVY